MNQLQIEEKVLNNGVAQMNSDDLEVLNDLQLATVGGGAGDVVFA